MKKILGIIFMAIMLAAGSAYACDWCNGSHTDTAYGAGYAGDPDKSFSQSGYGNDQASANAFGGGGFWVSAETTGNHFAGAEVDGIAKGYADTCTYAVDFGTTSKAGAISTVEGWSYAEGGTIAGFTDWRGRGVDSTIQGETYFDAQVQQANGAAETGYSAGWVDGGNSSFASISNGKGFYNGNDFYGANYEDGYTEGIITTRGNTEVSIDPYGNYRGFSASTKTSSYADTNHRGDIDATYTEGRGGVAGVMTNSYGAMVTGDASFNYAGNCDTVEGRANVNAQIEKTSWSTTVRVEANSFSGFGD